MFIIWSGWGLLAPLYGLIGLAVVVGLSDVVGPDQGPIAYAIGGVVAAGLCWLSGSFLPGRLWFIPVKYFGVVYLGLFGTIAANIARTPANAATVAPLPLATASTATKVADDTPGTNLPTPPKAEPVEPTPPAAAVPTGPARLLWELRDEKDQITDKSEHRAVSEIAFKDSVSLEAYVACREIGIEFHLIAFRGQNAAPFAWNNENKVGFRMRIDGAAVRTVVTEAQYTNDLMVLFYEPVAVRAALGGAVPTSDTHDQGKKAIGGIFATFLGATAFYEFEQRGIPELAVLPKAASIRVELPLADGGARVVDLNPQNPAAKQIIDGCIARYRPLVDRENRQSEKERKAKEAAQQKKEVDEKARQQRQTQMAEIDRTVREQTARLKAACVPGRMMQLTAYSAMRSLPELNTTQRPTGPLLPSGTKVQVALPSEVPASARVPDHLCVVKTTTMQGFFIGGIPANMLAPL